MRFRLTFIAALEAQPGAIFLRECNTYKEIQAARELVADYTLFLHDKKLMVDHSNMAIVEVMCADGEWLEVNTQDDFIDAWHDGQFENVTLHGALGLTASELAHGGEITSDETARAIKNPLDQ